MIVWSCVVAVIFTDIKCCRILLAISCPGPWIWNHELWYKCRFCLVRNHFIMWELDEAELIISLLVDWFVIKHSTCNLFTYWHECCLFSTSCSPWSPRTHLCFTWTSKPGKWFFSLLIWILIIIFYTEEEYLYVLSVSCWIKDNFEMICHTVQISCSNLSVWLGCSGSPAYADHLASHLALEIVHSFVKLLQYWAFILFFTLIWLSVPCCVS